MDSYAIARAESRISDLEFEIRRLKSDSERLRSNAQQLSSDAQRLEWKERFRPNAARDLLVGAACALPGIGIYLIITMVFG
jgi:hypothetical protein